MGRESAARRAVRRAAGRAPAVQALERRQLLSFELLTDINTSTLHSSPFEFTDVNGTIFFRASEPTRGPELYKFDGTTTTLVKDINPGPLGSANGDAGPYGVQGSMVSYKGLLYFAATDGKNGIELWRSDGTETGTVMVKDIWPGGNASRPGNLTVVGDTLYFTANDGTTGNEIWNSDGTATGTVRVSDIVPGTSSPSFNTQNGFKAFKNELYFTAFTSANGTELYKTDGTTVGILKEIGPGTSSGGPSDLTVLGDHLYFRANDQVNGTELWRTDGTAAGTVPLTNNATTNAPQALEPMGGRLYFFLNNTNVFNGLHEYDPAAGAVTPVKAFTSATLNDMTAVGDQLFFTAADAQSGAGTELWVSDGTPDGTKLVEDLSPGTASTFLDGPGTQFDGRFYFQARPQGSNLPTTHVYVSDGTAEGTFPLALAQGASQTRFSPAVMATSLGVAFTGIDLEHGAEPWITGGAVATTRIMGDVNTLTGPSGPSKLFEINGRYVFAAATGTLGRELWVTDGTAAGTRLLKNINPIPPVVQQFFGGLPPDGGSSPGGFTRLGGHLYFTANQPGATGVELWRTDGTPEGTTLVKDINLGAGSANPASLAVFNGHLYFRAADGVDGVELWRTDGTADGTTQVKDIVDGAGSSSPTWLTVHDNALYFGAVNPTGNVELWKSDGTDAGTTPVREIWVSSGQAAPTAQNLVSFGGALFFTGRDLSIGAELWRSDGTAAGTGPVFDLNGGSFSSNPASFTPFGDSLYFTASTASTGTELFRWTAASGVTLVQNINPNAANANPGWLTPFNGKLYFTATDAEAGTELWRTGGTTTARLLDLRTGTTGASISNLNVIGDTLWFSAAGDNNLGVELYRSDGTAEGTHFVQDLRPGSASSSPVILGVIDGDILLSADDGTLGTEPFISTGPNLPPTVSINGPAEAIENRQFSDAQWTAQAFDPEGTAVSYEWDFDYDGVTFTMNQQGPTVRIPNLDGPSDHTFAVRVTDGAGLSRIVTKTVKVLNVDPTINVSFHDPGGFEGAPYRVIFNPTGEVADDRLQTYTIHWGDGTTGVVPAGTTTTPVTHVYANGPGIYTISGYATDEDGVYPFPPFDALIENRQPTVNAGPDRTATEGDTLTLSATATDPGNDPLTYRWNIVLDGVVMASGVGSSFQHTFTPDGVYRVNFFVSDDADATGEDFLLVTVADAGPNADAGPDRSGVEGQPITLIGAGGGEGALYRWEAFDPAGDPVLFLEGRQITFVPPDDRVYRVVLTVVDSGGSDTDEAIITGTPLRATPTLNDSPPSITELQRFEFVAGALDGPADTAAGFLFRWTISYPGKPDLIASGDRFLFQPADDGVYTITLKAVDKDGLESATLTRTITVINEAPAATLSSPGGTEGSPTTVGFADVVDSKADLAAGLRYSFDFNNDGDFTDPGDILDSPSPAAAFTFRDNGSFDVRGRITDKDGASRDFTTQVAVANVAPVARMSGPRSIKKNRQALFQLTATDPSPADAVAPFRFFIDWNGDGRIDQTVNGRSGTIVSHVFRTRGRYSIMLFAMDKDGTVSKAFTHVIDVV